MSFRHRPPPPPEAPAKRPYARPGPRLPERVRRPRETQAAGVSAGPAAGGGGRGRPGGGRGDAAAAQTATLLRVHAWEERSRTVRTTRSPPHSQARGSPRPRREAGSKPPKGQGRTQSTRSPRHGGRQTYVLGLAMQRCSVCHGWACARARPGRHVGLVHGTPQAGLHGREGCSRCPPGGGATTVNVRLPARRWPTRKMRPASPLEIMVWKTDTWGPGNTPSTRRPEQRSCMRTIVLPAAGRPFLAHQHCQRSARGQPSPPYTGPVLQPGQAPPHEGQAGRALRRGHRNGLLPPRVQGGGSQVRSTANASREVTRGRGRGIQGQRGVPGIKSSPPLPQATG